MKQTQQPVAPCPQLLVLSRCCSFRLYFSNGSLDNITQVIHELLNGMVRENFSTVTKSNFVGRYDLYMIPIIPDPTQRRRTTLPGMWICSAFRGDSAAAAAKILPRLAAGVRIRGAAPRATRDKSQVPGPQSWERRCPQPPTPLLPPQRQRPATCCLYSTCGCRRRLSPVRGEWMESEREPIGRETIRLHEITNVSSNFWYRSHLILIPVPHFCTVGFLLFYHR